MQNYYHFARILDINNLTGNRNMSINNKIALSHFKNSKQFYHVYKTDSSNVFKKFHYHDYYQIGFVSEGPLMHSQEGHSLKLEKGDIFIIPPGLVHLVSFLDKSSELYTLSFKEQLFFSGFVSSAAYKFLSSISIYTMNTSKMEVQLRVRLNDNLRKSVQALFECLLQEFPSNRTGDQTASGGIVAAIMLILAQGYYSNTAENASFQTNSYRKSIEKCIEYIDQNYMYSLDMPSLLKRFAFSRSTFSILFPKYAGTGFTKYVNQKRIEQAQRLVKHKQLPLYEVAAMVGYNDFSTFYRNFVKLVGMSPAKFRAKFSS